MRHTFIAVIQKVSGLRNVLSLSECKVCVCSANRTKKTPKNPSPWKPLKIKRLCGSAVFTSPSAFIKHKLEAQQPHYKFDKGQILSVCLFLSAICASITPPSPSLKCLTWVSYEYISPAAVSFLSTRFVSVTKSHPCVVGEAEQLN